MFVCLFFLGEIDTTGIDTGHREVVTEIETVITIIVTATRKIDTTEIINEATIEYLVH